MSNMIHDYMKFTFNKSKYIVNSAKSSILKVRGGQIEYSKFGSGEPLLMIMGYAGSMNGWDIRFLNELAQSNEVIVFSNRNTGMSLFEEKDYTVEDMANDVELLREGLNLNKISICGISMGGIIAQQYAFMYPTNLKKISLINSLPPGNLIVMPDYGVQKTLGDLPKGNFITYWKMINMLFPSLWQAANLGLFHFKPENSKNIVPAQTLLEQQKVMEGWSQHSSPKAFLQTINTPTQILVGKADQLIPPVNSQILKCHLSNSELLQYDKAGHVMIYQKPLIIARDINQFITDKL